MDEVLGPVRLVNAGSFRMEGKEFVNAWLELDGRQLAAGHFHITAEDFAALDEALGGLPPRSRGGVRRFVADRIPADVVTVRDRYGREWFRLHEAKWSRLGYQGHWTEGQLVFEAGPVVEVPGVTYAIPAGERDFVRTDLMLADLEGDGHGPVQAHG